MNKPTTEMEAILLFLDADSYEDKWNLLGIVHEFKSEHLINTLAASMDIVIEDGSLEERFEELRSCVNTRRRYEIDRRK